MKHDYWIGDHVWVSSLATTGIFEGEKDDFAIIKIRSEKKLFPFSDISLLPEENEYDPLPDEARDHSSSASAFLDLHIETLNPSLIHAEPAMILAHQRSRLQDFIRNAIDHRVREITVIHGKGEGVLRSEVLTIIAQYPEVISIEPESHGGAVVLKLKH